GKQNSFASRARASYLRAEKGTQQPRQLSAAFFKPVRGDDLLAASITAVEDLAEKMNKAYGDCFAATKSMHVANGEGSLADIITFCTSEDA
ncbi:MAG: type I-E CRISPR-associated protein Cas7/Cse4/CasC, partial [Alphaproteobacteria bacterium]|nr:type I-E CRISPR-associated protein Cas7/Cse4/CasC [Alphaproteobacteria bacterium]